jgi:rhomboid protease GluP
LITCQKCRALLEPGTRECPYCRTDQRRHRAPSESQDALQTTRFGLWLLGTIVGIYFLMILLDPERSEARRFEPSAEALTVFGWARLDLVRQCGQYWRLLASMFLHSGLLHLVLNSAALYYLIPIAAQTFGVHRAICVYFGSGLCGAWASTAMGNSGVGASGALCGLIAAAAVYGWRRGGSLGRSLSSGMVSWAAMILVLGFFARNVDHAGHIGGFVGGLGLGWLAAAARARGGQADRAWMFFARVAVSVALVVAAALWAPFAWRSRFEWREAELYHSHAGRTLGNLDAALSSPAAGPKPPSDFPEGPPGSEGVRDAVRRALALAATSDPAAREALSNADTALLEWSTTFRCRYGVLGTGSRSRK